MKRKIAMLLDNPFRPDPRVLREAEALTSSGYAVTIFAWDRDIEVHRPAKESFGSINVIRIPVKSRQQLGIRQIPHYLMYAWRVFWLIIRGEYQAVHCHDLLNLPIGVFLKLLKRVRLVYDAHEIYWIMEAQKYPPLILSVLQRSENFLLRWVDAFITVGSVRAEYYQKYYKRTIFVVGNWYDPQTPAKEMGQALRRSCGIPENAFVVTFAGTLSPERAPEVLIKAAHSLQDDMQPIHWLIGGRGPAEPAMKQAASRNPNFHFLGWVEDTTSLYSASNALIYLMDLSNPYTVHNSPNNLYLSIAWALPLIAVNAGEVAAVLTSAKTAILIDDIDARTVASAVHKLAHEPALYAQCVENLKELQDTFSWASAAESLRSAYAQALRKR